MKSGLSRCLPVRFGEAARRAAGYSSLFQIILAKIKANHFPNIYKRVEPVSYTHLDVYKRQHEHSLNTVIECTLAYMDTGLFVNHTGLLLIQLDHSCKAEIKHSILMFILFLSLYSILVYFV